MAANFSQRLSDLGLPFCVARRKAPFEVDQPGVVMGDRKLLLILLV
jgi:hypothetical protein